MNKKLEHLNFDKIISLGRRAIFEQHNYDKLTTTYYTFWGVERIDICLYTTNITSIESLPHESCLKYVIKHDKGTDTIICDKLEIEEVKDSDKEEIERVATKTHEENIIRMLLTELEKKDPDNWIVNLIKEDFFPDSI